MSNLTTTWTEQSVVAFTAGTLASINDMKSRVEGKIKPGSLSATSVPTSDQVQQDLIYAKEKFCEELGFTWTRKYAYANTSASTHRYAMPADYTGGQVSLRDVTNDRRITYLDPFKFDLKYPDPSEESSDKPECFTIKDRELWLIPPAGGTYQLEVEYERSGDDDTATDFSYLPEIIRFKCCDFAIYQAFLTKHMWKEAQTYKAEWMDGLMRSKRADNRRKWQMVGQALTWQQWYNAKYNQWS